MFHTVAFYQSIDPAGVLTAINAVRDSQIFTTGIDLRVPAGLNNVAAVAALIADASAARAQLQAPSLRSFVNLDIEPIGTAATFSDFPELHDIAQNPLVLVPNEAINFLVQSDPVAAVDHYGTVNLADGPIQAVKGNIFTVRATAAIAQVVGVWTQGVLTFTQALPAGTYDVVGLRCRAVTGVVGRLVFPNQTARPGVPLDIAINNHSNSKFRNGNYGVWGRFEINQPPQLEVLGGTAVAQVVFLDLIKVG